MKILLAVTVITLALCQGMPAVEETCESIDCVGPFKECVEKNGKLKCNLLFVVPVTTCKTKKCPPGYICVGDGDCVKPAHHRLRRQVSSLLDQTKSQVVQQLGSYCGEVCCETNQVCLEEKCVSTSSIDHDRQPWFMWVWCVYFWSCEEKEELNFFLFVKIYQ